MQVVWSVEDWADAVVELPVVELCPDRTVLVPNERVAHTLRRLLVQRGAPHALVGTRFVTLLQLAREIASDVDESAVPNHRELGPTLVRETFSEVRFARFHREDLLSLPGWDEAFARTLADVEAALLTPAELIADGDPQVADVGRVLEALQHKAELVTSSALLQRAAVLAGARGGRGVTLAVVTGFESPAEVMLLRALPDLRWALWGIRPTRADHLTRTAKLLGEDFESALRLARPSTKPATALRRLQAALFGERSAAPAPKDDSVRIATYAGVHEEVEAAVTWVIEEIIEHGTAAQEIAILSPNAEPYGSLLRARLNALPWPGGCEPAFSQSGVPIGERSDGARLLLVIRALRDGLSREALAPLLPLLRASDETSDIRGLSRAWELLNEVAAVGGERGHQGGGSVWPEAWRSAALRLEQPAQGGGGGLEEREEKRRSALRRELSAHGAAIDALASVSRHVTEREPLAAVWQQLHAFAQSHLKLPPAVPNVLAVIADAMQVINQHAARQPQGDDALAWLEDTISSSRAASGRFGAPCVYLGTLAGVRGLTFRAVRMIGLVEGAVPSAAREDPVLPDSARVALSPFLLTSRQRAHRQLAAFDDAVRAAGERLALSAPRVSVEGSARQSAAVLLDVVQVLCGTSDARGLEQQLDDAARDGRTRERQLRERLAVSAGARLDRIARGDGALARADVGVALDLGQLKAIRERVAPGAQDGLMFGVLSPAAVPGLSAENPISASRLATLLTCPHQYLYENVLGFRAAAGALPSHQLQSMVFGTWLHGIAEEFWREHGQRLGTREGDLEEHRRELRELACERFEALRQTYPFANAGVAGAQQQALCDQLDKLLLLDWHEGVPRPFVDVERGFGFDAPCVLESAAGTLHVRGKIDKLDRDGSTLLVRDLKTGQGRPRKGSDAPDVTIDLQLGIYAQVAKKMAQAWGTPASVGVAYVYLRTGEPDRSWIGADYERLDAAAQEWLATAVETLQQGAFVRTAERDDCKYCPHQPVCAPEIERAEAVLADERVPRRLALLKARRRP